MKKKNIAILVSALVLIAVVVSGLFIYKKITDKKEMHKYDGIYILDSIHYNGKVATADSLTEQGYDLSKMYVEIDGKTMSIRGFNDEILDGDKELFIDIDKDGEIFIKDFNYTRASVGSSGTLLLGIDRAIFWFEKR